MQERLLNSRSRGVLNQAICSITEHIHIVTVDCTMHVAGHGVKKFLAVCCSPCSMSNRDCSEMECLLATVSSRSMQVTES